MDFYHVWGCLWPFEHSFKEMVGIFPTSRQKVGSYCPIIPSLRSREGDFGSAKMLHCDSDAETKTFTYFLKFFIYFWQREREGEGEGEGEEKNPKQALCCQHGAWCRARSHEPWDHDLSQNQEWTLNRATQAPLKLRLWHQKTQSLFSLSFTFLLQPLRQVSRSSSQYRNDLPQNCYVYARWQCQWFFFF